MWMDLAYRQGHAIYVDLFHRQRNRREFYQVKKELNAIQFWDKIPVECEISWSNTGKDNMEITWK